MIAGPCSVEEPERMDRIAAAVKRSGANIFRGGAYKPRTSPYAFQGLGEEGLKILQAAGRTAKMPVVTEVTDPRNVELVAQYSDMIQVGARNMQNFVLLTEVGKTHRPILLKRGMAASVNDLLMSAEYVLSQGNSQVVLCERGIRGFDNATRNLYDVAAVPLGQTLEPSADHRRPEPCDRSARFDSRMCIGWPGSRCRRRAYRSSRLSEVAKSDGPQALLPAQYDEVMQQMRKIAAVFGQAIFTCSGVTTLRKPFIAGIGK